MLFMQGLSEEQLESSPVQLSPVTRACGLPFHRQPAPLPCHLRQAMSAHGDLCTVGSHTWPDGTLEERMFGSRTLSSSEPFD